LSLGALPGDVLGRVVRQGVTLVLIGLAVGLPVAALASSFLRKFLYGLSPIDGPTYGAIALLFLATAIVASLGPALRAARTDPIRVLRE
jgi:ABC-type antimicrobial peptide transport system permease subunit